jgi:hypothetical protein
MQLNTGDADDYLSLDDKKELLLITKLIKDKTSSKDKAKVKKTAKDREVTPVVNDHIIKKRLVKFFLGIIDKTPSDIGSIQNTAYLMTGFVFYEFDSELDSILDKAGDLEVSQGDDAVKLLGVIKDDLSDYLKKL